MQFIRLLFCVSGLMFIAGCRSEYVEGVDLLIFPSSDAENPEVFIGYDSFRTTLPGDRLYPFDEAGLADTSPLVGDEIDVDTLDEELEVSTQEKSTADEDQADSELSTTVVSPTIVEVPTENLPEIDAEKNYQPEFGLFDTNHVSVVRSSEALQFCEHIDSRLSSVSFRNCLNPEMHDTSHVSNFGQPIFYTDFAKINSRQPIGKVLILGGVHGDELTSVSCVFLWVNILKKYHTGLFHWRIVPLVNPDGFFQETPRRTNGNGVDLNRNLPTDNWKALAHKYWKTRASGETRKYPGPNPASEPETKWLVQEIEEFQPDVIVTVHAPYNLVDYDAADRLDAPGRLGILPGKSLGTFPGSLGRYAGEQRDIPVITIELPHSTIMPSEEEVRRIWVDLVYWLKQNLPNRKSRSIAAEEDGSPLG